MGFSSAVRCRDGTAVAGRDFDGFDGAAPLCQLKANEHESSFASTLVPSGHVHKEISCGVGNGGVVAVDDGGEGEDVVVLVENERVLAHPLQKVCVFHALGVLQKNIAYGHGLVACQRHKGPVTFNGCHPERGSQGCKIMNADGGALAPSSQCEMEFLLVVHESLDELFNVLVVPR